MTLEVSVSTSAVIAATASGATLSGGGDAAKIPFERLVYLVPADHRKAA
jgi:hypothetical protein